LPRSLARRQPPGDVGDDRRVDVLPAGKVIRGRHLEVAAACRMSIGLSSAAAAATGSYSRRSSQYEAGRLNGSSEAGAAGDWPELPAARHLAHPRRTPGHDRRTAPGDRPLIDNPATPDRTRYLLSPILFPAEKPSPG
jgi:hypothetical protein